MTSLFIFFFFEEELFLKETFFFYIDHLQITIIIVFVLYTIISYKSLSIRNPILTLYTKNTGYVHNISFIL